MSRIVLVTGGARSGKSSFAEGLARKVAGGEGRVLYTATARPDDAEMAARIEAHRRRRAPEWSTIEVDGYLSEVLLDAAAGFAVVLVDCLTIYVARLIERGLSREDLLREANGLIRACRAISGTSILVSNEVGMGIVPAFPAGRSYRDLLGEFNQLIAAHAGEVYFVVAGLAMELKRLEAAALAGEPEGNGSAREPLKRRGGGRIGGA